MKMNLKKPKQKLFKKALNIKLSNKNLVIFLASLLLVSIIIGIIFFLYINTNDKEALNQSIKNVFEIPDSIEYFEALKTNLKDYTFDYILIWLLGLSVIGIILVIFLFFTEGFSIGFALAGIFNTYGIKGVIASFSYLFPTKIIYLLGLFMITFFASKISYKIIKILFLKKEITIRNDMQKYTRILVICLILATLTSIFKTFIDPFMIKFFTFF